jgi:AraC-like DNA-binding protein
MGLGQVRHGEARRDLHRPIEKAYRIAPIQVESVDGSIEELDGLRGRTGESISVLVGQQGGSSFLLNDAQLDIAGSRTMQMSGEKLRWPVPIYARGDSIDNERGAGSLVRSADNKTENAAIDAIQDILRTTRLSGGIFLEAEFTAPWCVISKIEAEDCVPFVPEPANIIGYHYVSAGSLLLETDDEPPVTVESGEIVVLPRNDAHRLGSALDLRPVRTHDLIQPASDGGVARIVHGGGGETTRVFCGFLGNDAPNDPLIRILPAVLKVNVADGASGNWIESSLKFAAQEVAAGVVRSPAVLAKLTELMFMEAVHRYLTSLPPERSGWRAGVRDPVVGRALALLHSRMSQRWTAEDLARQVGLSRSALAERFTRIMGEPPIRYLARQRLQAAAQRLQGSNDSVARIAFKVGYESEAAFNRAFKREFGVPPATWRKAELG